jgi:hypothetical protein
MPAELTVTGSTVACKETAKPVLVLVAWPITATRPRRGSLAPRGRRALSSTVAWTAAPASLGARHHGRDATKALRREGMARLGPSRAGAGGRRIEKEDEDGS